jgi:hypothetical protein
VYKSILSAGAQPDITTAVLYYHRIGEDLKGRFIAALEKKRLSLENSAKNVFWYYF